MRTQTKKQNVRVFITVLEPPEGKLFDFIPTTVKELNFVISPAKSTTCQLDPIVTFLLKQCADMLLPIIVKILDLSVLAGIVPSCLERDYSASSQKEKFG